jgi:hypothetical protein
MESHVRSIRDQQIARLDCSCPRCQAGCVLITSCLLYYLTIDLKLSNNVKIRIADDSSFEKGGVSPRMVSLNVDYKKWDTHLTVVGSFFGI